MHARGARINILHAHVGPERDDRRRDDRRDDRRRDDKDRDRHRDDRDRRRDDKDGHRDRGRDRSRSRERRSRRSRSKSADDYKSHPGPRLNRKTKFDILPAGMTPEQAAAVALAANAGGAIADPMAVAALGGLPPPPAGGRQGGDPLSPPAWMDSAWMPVRSSVRIACMHACPVIKYLPNGVGMHASCA